MYCFFSFVCHHERSTHPWTNVLASRWRGQMIHWLSSRSTRGLVMQSRTTLWVSAFQRRITMAKRLLDYINTRSTTCMGWSNNGEACSQCRKLIPKVENLRRLSQQPQGRLNYQYQGLYPCLLVLMLWLWHCGLVMCWAGLQALSPLGPARSSPAQARP
jgi:hypothetical protein